MFHFNNPNTRVNANKKTAPKEIANYLQNKPKNLLKLIDNATTHILKAINTKANEEHLLRDEEVNRFIMQPIEQAFQKLLPGQEKEDVARALKTSHDTLSQAIITKLGTSAQAGIDDPKIDLQQVVHKMGDHPNFFTTSLLGKITVAEVLKRLHTEKNEEINIPDQFKSDDMLNPPVEGTVAKKLYPNGLFAAVSGSDTALSETAKEKLEKHFNGGEYGKRVVSGFSQQTRADLDAAVREEVKQRAMGARGRLGSHSSSVDDGEEHPESKRDRGGASIRANGSSPGETKRGAEDLETKLDVSSSDDDVSGSDDDTPVPRTERALSAESQAEIKVILDKLPEHPLKKASAVFTELQENPVHFLLKGKLHNLKVTLSKDTPLADELTPLTVPGRPFLVDSESTQKDRTTPKMINYIHDLLDKSTKSGEKVGSLLNKSLTALSADDKKEIPSPIKKLLDAYFRTAPEQESTTLRAGLMLIKQRLTMKVALIGDGKGEGGILTGNHLGVRTETTLFSRSARFNSPDKMRTVVHSAMSQEYQKLREVLGAAPQPMRPLIRKFNNKEVLTKQESRQLNTLFRSEGVSLYINIAENFKSTETRPPELRMPINLISAMDSTKPGEDKLWDSLTAAHEIIRQETLYFQADDNSPRISLDPPLLTESSQSSFGGGFMASIRTDTTKTDKRAVQLEDRLTLLRKQQKLLGKKCFTSAFNNFLDIESQMEVGQVQLKLTAKKLSGAERAFLDYYIAVKEKNPPHQGAFDKLFKPKTNVLTLEMGDIAFSELGGVHDHVSCKSGQDRTLTLTALRVAISKCGWPGNLLLPTDRAKYKAKFAAEFFTTIGTQGKAVVEHARGDGGKLKFNLGEFLNEQPVPGAIFDYMQSSEGEPARRLLLETLDNEVATVGNKAITLRDGLKTVKMPPGLFKIMVEQDTSLLNVGKSPDDKNVLLAFFTKKQSPGKKKLRNLFQKTMEIDARQEELTIEKKKKADLELFENRKRISKEKFNLWKEANPETFEKLKETDDIMFKALKKHNQQTIEELTQALKKNQSEITNHRRAAGDIPLSLLAQDKVRRGKMPDTQSLQGFFETYASQIFQKVHKALNPSDRPLPPIPSRSGGGVKKDIETGTQRGRTYTHAESTPFDSGDASSVASPAGVMFATSATEDSKMGDSRDNIVAIVKDAASVSPATLKAPTDSKDPVSRKKELELTLTQTEQTILEITERLNNKATSKETKKKLNAHIAGLNKAKKHIFEAQQTIQRADLELAEIQKASGRTIGQPLRIRELEKIKTDADNLLQTRKGTLDLTNFQWASLKHNSQKSAKRPGK